MLVIEGRNEMQAEYIACRDQMPPEGTLVMTKIDDGRGVRNEQALAFYRNLWWTGEGADAMYVYYTPTHWKALQPNPPTDR